MKTVVLWTDTFAPTVNGIATHVSELASALHGHGFRTVVVAPCQFGGHLAHRRQGHRYERVCVAASRYAPGRLREHASPLSLRHLRNWDVPNRDVVFHVHTPFILGEWAARVAQRNRIRLVFTSHMRSGNVTKFLPDSQPVQRLGHRSYWHQVRRIARRASQVIVPGEDVAEEFAYETGVVPSVISSGVDTSTFSAKGATGHRPRGAVLQVMYAGRLDVDKDVLRVIHETRRAVDAGAKLYLRVVGDGPLRPTILGEISRLGLSSTVELLPSQSPAELATLYRLSDVCFVPGLIESRSKVALEAVACGTLILGPNQGGTAELIPLGFGLGYDPAVSGSAADALVRMYRDPRLLRLPSSARKVVEENSMDAVCKRLIGVYGLSAS